MAERNFDFVETIGRKKRFVTGSWTTNGNEAPGVLASTRVKGFGFTVAYISQGLYRITFANSYLALQSGVPHLQSASAADDFAQLGPYVAADRTLDVRIVDDGGAVVDPPAAAANNAVHFMCVFDDALQV